MAEMMKYLTWKKLVSEAIKKAFPGLEFAIQKTSNNSATLYWKGGPNHVDMKKVVGMFAGKLPVDETDYAPSRVLIIDGEEFYPPIDYLHYQRVWDEDEARKIRKEFAERRKIPEESISLRKLWNPPEKFKHALEFYMPYGLLIPFYKYLDEITQEPEELPNIESRTF